MDTLVPMLLALARHNAQIFRRRPSHSLPVKIHTKRENRCCLPVAFHISQDRTRTILFQDLPILLRKWHHVHLQVQDIQYLDQYLAPVGFICEMMTDEKKELAT